MAPLISVVVPTYQRPQLLKECLTALCAQDLSLDAFEIVIANDGGDPDTRALVKTYSQDCLIIPVIRYLEISGHHGPATARNCGWRNATGKLIAFTDDDCMPKPDWLRLGLEALEQGADAAWGRLIMPVPRTPTDYEKDASQLAHAEFITANCFCRKSVLERIGGFDERFRLAWREDSDLFFNLLDLNAAVVHVNNAVVVHPIRPAPWGVSIAQQRKALFDALLYKKHPNHYRNRIRRLPPWNYYVIVTSLLTAVGCALIGQSGVAGLAGMIWAVFTFGFMFRRLHGTSRQTSHVVEMLLTSSLIPPLALYWHWRGVFKFRVLYV